MNAARLAANATAAALVVSLCACSCHPHERVPLPAADSDDYRSVMTDIATHDRPLSIVLHVGAQKPGSPSTKIFMKLGYLAVTPHGLTATPFAHRQSPSDTFGAGYGNEALSDIPIGEQRPVRLTFADEEDRLCHSTGGSDREYGVIMRATSLNPLGRALLAAHLLVYGKIVRFHTHPRPWGPSRDIEQVWAVGTNTNLGFEQGERLGTPETFS